VFVVVGVALSLISLQAGVLCALGRLSRKQQGRPSCPTRGNLSRAQRVAAAAQYGIRCGSSFCSLSLSGTTHNVVLLPSTVIEGHLLVKMVTRTGTLDNFVLRVARNPE
jgi:hypothetical protein